MAHRTNTRLIAKEKVITIALDNYTTDMLLDVEQPNLPVAAAEGGFWCHYPHCYKL